MPSLYSWSTPNAISQTWVTHVVSCRLIMDRNFSFCQETTCPQKKQKKVGFMKMEVNYVGLWRWPHRKPNKPFSVRIKRRKFRLESVRTTSFLGACMSRGVLVISKPKSSSMEARKTSLLHSLKYVLSKYYLIITILWLLVVVVFLRNKEIRKYY